MDAISLGPFVLSADRFWVLLALFVFLGLAEVLARVTKLELSNWAWNTALLTVLGAWLGFVIMNLSVYAREPLTAFYFWQGGFSALWGLAAGLFYSLWTLHKDKAVLRPMVISALLGLAVWLTPLVLPNQQTPAMQLPYVELEHLNGESVNLAQFMGRPVVLNLWATWCPPCRRELPLLLDTAADNPAVAFVFVNQAESGSTVQSYLDERNLSMKLALRDSSNTVSRHFRTKGMPTTLFFDGSGELAASHVGEVSRAALENYLDKIRSSEN